MLVEIVIQRRRTRLGSAYDEEVWEPGHSQRPQEMLIRSLCHIVSGGIVIANPYIALCVPRRRAAEQSAIAPYNLRVVIASKFRIDAGILFVVIVRRLRGPSRYDIGAFYVARRRCVSDILSRNALHLGSASCGQRFSPLLGPRRQCFRPFEWGRPYLLPHLIVSRQHLASERR